MTSFPRLPEFIRGSKAIKMYLKIGDHPEEPLPTVMLQNYGKHKIPPNPFYSIELPPVFSHMSFLLIETLSATQHGEFVTRSKQGKHETIVELSGHVSHRYGVTQEELEEIQQAYEQILDTWIVWRQFYKKT